jgi:hypothetical protein
MIKTKIGRPKKAAWGKCLFAGCTETTEGSAKGFCRTHYMAFRRGRITADGSETRPMKRVPSYGPGARCLVPECERRPKGRGLCAMHYQQWDDGIDLGVEVPDRGHEKVAATYGTISCRVEGCLDRAMNRWMCSKHTQQREAGIIDGAGKKLRELMPRGKRPLDWRKELAGYILVRAPKDHPGARHDGSIYQHRLVVEEMLGRYLTAEEVVHHKNGVRDDNRPENLELRTSRKEHPHGHETDIRHATQVLLQQSNLPTPLKNALQKFRRSI